MNTLKKQIGCWFHERRRTELSLLRGQWRDLCNRHERLAVGSDPDARECLWVDSSWLTVARVFPSVGARLFRRCFAECPLAAGAPCPPADGLPPNPSVSVVIPVSGSDRRRAFEAVLSSFLAQDAIAPEMVVVESGERPEYAAGLPPHVRYLHLPPQPGERGFSRARTFNAGVALSSGACLVLHDADIVVPRTYLKAVVARLRGGWDALQPLRYLFYLGEQDSLQFISAAGAFCPRRIAEVRQNFSGGSVAATRAAYLAIGGYDEDFSGWGGEDSEFLDRLETVRLFRGAFAPAVHLWHSPQERGGSGDGNAGLLSEKRRASAPERAAKLAARWRARYGGTGAGNEVLGFTTEPPR